MAITFGLPCARSAVARPTRCSAPAAFAAKPCQTEYYLGSDNVTVTVRHQYLPAPGGLPRREQPLAPLGRHRNPLYEWHTFSGNRVYVLGKLRLYRVAQQPDRLVDVTDTLLGHFPPASGGVAQVQFDDSQ